MDYALTTSIWVCIYAVLATSTNVIVGHAGMLAICQGALYGVGAYASALVSLRLGLSVPVAFVFAMMSTAIVAAVVAIPLLRLQGDYFILGSLGIQIIILDIIRNADDITNGTLGLSRIPRPALFGYEASSPADYAILYAVIAAVWVVMLHTLISAPFGRALHAVRDDAVAAEGFGKNAFSFRIRAFALSSAGVGLAGAMYAHYVTYIDPTTFVFAESIYILSMVIIGGTASTRGALAGAALLVVIPELLRFVGISSAAADSYVRQILYALLLIAFAFLRPDGLFGKKVF
ncbi:MAG: branched-chain amino acid ABC transporter permease [Xanthobacteraceae bacterium]|nr:branched-chain amino acid ABC transporter permease [Xanthobacteraceae bacterium]